MSEIQNTLSESNDIANLLSLALENLGYSNEWIIRTTEPIVCTSGLLEDILLRKKYPKSSQEDIDGPEDSDDIFRQHLEVMSKSSQGKQYYDVQLIYSTGQRAIAKAKFAILQILHKLNLYCPDMSFRN